MHIAGLDIEVGGRFLRQRCAWCGAVLVDYDLERVAAPVGQDPRPSVWPPGDLVRVDGNVSAIVPHADGEKLPADCCAALDPEATR